MRRATASVIAAILAVGIACAGPGGSSGDGPDVLTSQQIRDVEAKYNNMHSVIQALRPNWFQTRGAVSFNVEDAEDPVLFLDGNRRGTLEALREISPTNIREVEFLDAREATTRYGTGYSGGIIMLKSRSGD